jgi:TolB protein
VKTVVAGVVGGLGLWLGVALAPAAERRAPSQPGQPRIIFSSNRSGPWRIWSVRPDGSALSELTKAGPEEHDVDPVASPDGKRILLTSTRGGPSGVWTLSADGSNPQRICDGDQADWSPDGLGIVFRRSEQIWTRELATSRQKRITPEDWPHCSGPAWSPDGKQIAFACRWEAGNALFLVDAAGGKPAVLYDKQGACKPGWAPDGKRLVYETETHISTIDPDGKKNRLVTYFGGVQRYGRFSPDGKSIVYCQGPSERGPWELYIIPAQGGTPKKLTEDGSDMTPDWK